MTVLRGPRSALWRLGLGHLIPVEQTWGEVEISDDLDPEVAWAAGVEEIVGDGVVLRRPLRPLPPPHPLCVPSPTPGLAAAERPPRDAIRMPPVCLWGLASRFYRALDVWRPTAPPRTASEALVVAESITTVRLIGRLLHDYLALAAVQEAARGPGGSHLKRLPWPDWAASTQDPAGIMRQLEDYFDEPGWSTSHGGPRWAKIARAVVFYYELPIVSWIDYVVGLAHSGGLCYDKGYLLGVCDPAQFLAWLDRKLQSEHPWPCRRKFGTTLPLVAWGCGRQTWRRKRLQGQVQTLDVTGAIRVQYRVGSGWRELDLMIPTDHWRALRRALAHAAPGQVRPSMAGTGRRYLAATIELAEGSVVAVTFRGSDGDSVTAEVLE